MKTLTPADRQMIADLIEIRHGMEAMHQAVYGGLPDPDVDARLDQFDYALDVIRRRVPDQLMDQTQPPRFPTGRPNLAVAPGPST